MIVPDGVLFGSSKAHKALRQILVEDQKLEAVVSLPPGVFRPYAGVSTAILVFTKTMSGGTDFVWFYDVESDGWSLDDKRAALLSEDKLGPTPRTTLKEAEHPSNNLPDVLRRWKERNATERPRQRSEQSFCVPKGDIVDKDYELSVSRFRETMRTDTERRSPAEIIDTLLKLEGEIQRGLKELEAML